MPCAGGRARAFALFFGEISPLGASSTATASSSTASTPGIPRLWLSLWMERSGRGPGGDDSVTVPPLGDQALLAVQLGADRPGNAQPAALDV